MKDIIRKIDDEKQKVIERLKEPAEPEKAQIECQTLEAKIWAFNKALEVIREREIETISDGYHNFKEI